MRPVFTLRTLAIATSLIVLMALVSIGSFGMWVNRNLVDSETFVAAFVEAFGQESSQQAIADVIVVRPIDDRPLIALARPLLVDLVAELLDGDRLEELLTGIGTRLHAALFDGSQEGIVVDLTPVGEALMPPLERFFPAVADEMPTERFREIVIVEPGAVPEIAPYASASRVMVLVAVILSIVLGAAIIRMWRSKRKAVVSVGIAVAVAGVLTAVLVNQARAITISSPDNDNVKTLVVNLFDEVAGALRFQGLLLAALGLVVASVGLFMRNPAAGDGTNAIEAG
jgi:hypothetical protein